MIYNWALWRGETRLAAVQTCATNIEQTKVVSKALDGSVYIQTIGAGTLTADVDVHVSSREDREAVNRAEAEGALVNVLYRERRYYGYIEAAPAWTPVVPGRSYAASVKLLVEMVV